MPSTDPADRLNAATFAAQATHYAGHRPGYPPELVEALAALAPARDSAWDCGTGNGQLALALAERFDHVSATDASAEQIAVAPPHPRVAYRVVAAEDAELPRASVALVTVAQALHWFDLERFYPRVRHALRDGGVFAAIGYAGFAATPAIDAELHRVVLERLAPYWARGNRLVWGGYRDLAFPFDEIALPPFELTVRWTLDRYLGYLASERRLSTRLALRAGRVRGAPPTA